LHAILVVLVVAAQASDYEATVATFGCTSIKETHRLQSLRAEPEAFQMALVEKQVHGECVAILQGTMVEGSIETSDESILRVNMTVDPPGYEAPLDDFERKPTVGSQ
jgi:hypothetical protein